MNISPGSNESVRVLLTDIEDNPFQVRTTYDESTLTALAASILDVGLLQVPLARRVGEKYQLAFGHRRKIAFEQLSRSGVTAYESMPLMVTDLSDREMFELAIAENIKRADLNPIEKATALRRYMDEFGATSVQAARLFGVPEGTVRGTVRLLKLPEDAKQKLRTGQMTQRAARKILEKPETELRRLEPKDGVFNLREKLMILVYDRYRSDVSDELLFKKIQAIVELNKQLEHQVETMNARRLERAKVDLLKPKMQPASMTRRT